MKIYTKTGDEGETSLFSGDRIRKDSHRIRAIGAVDEVNSMLGLIASEVEKNPDVLKKQLKQIFKVQSKLLQVGADLATPINAREAFAKKIKRITKTDVNSLEKQIDDMSEVLPKLTKFILPGGELASSFAHQTRSVCRRAERDVVALSDEEEINPHLLGYINRLSDWLFTLARFINHENGVEDRFAE